VRQGLLGDHSLRHAEQKDDDAAAAKRQGGVLCISIGDGSTPRTACLAAFLTGWTTVAVDPALRRDWSGPAPKGVDGLHSPGQGRKKRFLFLNKRLKKNTFYTFFYSERVWFLLREMCIFENIGKLLYK
jgi:hypothetical protein